MIKINKFFIPYIIFLTIIGFKGELVLSFFIVFLHESVHYLTAIYLGFHGLYIEILPIGVVLNLKDIDEASAKEDLLISLSGPLSNLILAIISYCIYIFTSNPLCYLFYSGNLAIGIFNLLPAFPLDGGRILRSYLSLKTIYKRANGITIKCSIFIGIFFMLYYIFLFFLGRNNINIGIVSLFIILCSLKEKERIVYLIMGDILKKKYKFINRGYIENKSISIYLKENLLSALNVIDKNKYNIFTILDDEMKVVDIVYEEEILEALKTYGNIKFENFIKIRDEDV